MGDSLLKQFFYGVRDEDNKDIWAYDDALVCINELEEILKPGKIKDYYDEWEKLNAEGHEKTKDGNAPDEVYRDNIIKETEVFKKMLACDELKVEEEVIIKEILKHMNEISYNQVN